MTSRVLGLFLAMAIVASVIIGYGARGLARRIRRHRRRRALARDSILRAMQDVPHDHDRVRSVVQRLGPEATADEVYACAIEGICDREGTMPLLGRQKSIDLIVRSELASVAQQAEAS